MYYVLIYLVAITFANLGAYLFGPWITPITSLVFIGIDLSIRDKLHDVWSSNRLWFKMFLLVLTGSLITCLINLEAYQIAIASVVAFTAASIGDTLVYHYLRRKPFLVKSNTSNLMAAALDSLLFPTIAFGSLMPSIVLLQFTAKILGGFVWSLVINRFRR
jgi:hypothetical protein